MKSHKTTVNYENFLFDSWWYALTNRITDKEFEDLAKLRARQGFDGVQLVVGLPPEIGPENPNALSKVGPAWTVNKEFNAQYLDFARDKIRLLNSLGLTVLVYGAWGQQIEWLGEKKMVEWWSKIISKLDDLNVLYCLTGESDIWIGDEYKFFPNKTSTDIIKKNKYFIHPRIIYEIKSFLKPISNFIFKSRLNNRRKKWSSVLSRVAPLTNKPILIHVLPKMTSLEAVSNHDLLDAITVQTSHERINKNLFWQLPLKITKQYKNHKFINLESWYEGILDDFKKDDQIFAYWTSMMAGSYAYCYGAHGIWNVGDGKFLAQWGKQTFKAAIKLDTPRLIGISKKFISQKKLSNFNKIKVEINRNTGELEKITRRSADGKYITYFPDVSKYSVHIKRNALYFLPLGGKFSKVCPETGQLVVLNNF